MQGSQDKETMRTSVVEVERGERKLMMGKRL
jgi:hypothetical protein